MNFRNISSRASLYIAFIIAGFGLIAITLTYYFSTFELNKQKTENLKSVLLQSGQTLEESILQSTRLSASIANNPLTIDLLQTASPSAKQLAVVDQNLISLNLGNIYSALYLIKPNGITIVSTDKTFTGQNYSFRPYFQKAISGEPYLDVNLGITSNKLGYYFSTPVANRDGKLIGVAVVKMAPEYFNSLLQKVQSNSMMDLIIADRFGVVVSSTKKARILSSLGKLKSTSLKTIADQQIYPGINVSALQYTVAQQMVDNNVSGINTTSIYDVEDNENELLAVLKINNAPFWIISEVSSDDIFEHSQEFGLIIVATVLLAVIGALICVPIVLSKMLSPIKVISRMATEIGGGNFNQINKIHTKDELGDLGNSIAIMATTLKNRYNDLENTASSQLVEVDQKNINIENSNIALTNLLEDLESSKNDLEKFKLAVENASDHIIITDPEGIVLFANSAVNKITGFTVDEILSKKAGVKDLWGGLMPKDFYNKLWQTVKIDKKTFSGEVTNHRKDGQKYTALASISPVLDQNGDVIYFVGIERDISHEKEVDRMKTDFISLASHQLRTPLSAMNWFSEMLLAGDAGALNPTQTEFVNNIALSNARMTDLVNSLLNISRIESGRIIVDPKPTNLTVLISEVITEIDINLKEKQQLVSVNIDPGLTKIKIDPKLIREVYKNLLTNANKYTPIGGKISITVSIKDKEILSQVSDNGLGIPKKDQSKIFERFYRAENIIKLETEGTGLGLYLAKSIVESSGGKIWFDSDTKTGTTFWFTLPLSGVKAKKGEVLINS